MGKLILYIVLGVSITLVMSFLNKKSTKEIKPDVNGNIELHLNKLYGTIGIICMLLGVIAFTASLVLIDRNDNWIAAISFLFILETLGFICHLWYKNHKIFFNSERIISTSVYGKKHSIKWSEVINIKFSYSSGLITFMGKGNTKVKAHMHLIGLSELVKSIEHYTTFTSKKLKLPIK